MFSACQFHLITVTLMIIAVLDTFVRTIGVLMLAEHIIPVHTTKIVSTKDVKTLAAS